MAAHRLVLAIAPLPLAVLVALVGGHVYENAHPLSIRAHRVEHVDRAHHVRRVSLGGLSERAAHERLGRHVDHHLRLGRAQHGDEGVAVTDIAADALHALPHPRQLIQRGIGRDIDREARHPGAERLQPERQPSPLEAGVPGQQHAAVAPEVGVDPRVGSGRIGSARHLAQAHVRHGASPALHSCSRWLRSRRVSIACQKPWWR